MIYFKSGGLQRGETEARGCALGDSCNFPRPVGLVRPHVWWRRWLRSTNGARVTRVGWSRRAPDVFFAYVCFSGLLMLLGNWCEYVEVDFESCILAT